MVLDHAKCRKAMSAFCFGKLHCRYILEFEQYSRGATHYMIVATLRVLPYQSDESLSLLQ